MDNTPTGNYNANSASVRRLLRECKEMSEDRSTLYQALPLEENLFEWHFTIRGPKDTEFEDGVYHGRILFPADYPYRPPDIVFLTRNGRFELEKKICLTISSHHAETWRPSWSSDGAIASLDWTPEERKKLAKQSLAYKCDKCGKHMMTALPPEDDNEKLSEVPEELQLRDAKPKDGSVSSNTTSSSGNIASSSSNSAASSSTAVKTSNYTNATNPSLDTSEYGNMASQSGFQEGYQRNNIPGDGELDNQEQQVGNNVDGYLQFNDHVPLNEGHLQVNEDNLQGQQEFQPAQAPTFATSMRTSQFTVSLVDSLDIAISIVVLIIGLLLVRKLYFFL